MFALLCADRLVLMTIITLFRESPRFKGALIFRSVHAARVHLRAAHNDSRRLFHAPGCLSHFRVMPCNRRCAGGLKSETKKVGKKIFGENEKKAKVRKLPIYDWRFVIAD